MVFTVDFSAKGFDLQSRFPWKVGIVSFMAFPQMLQNKDEILPSVKKIVEDSFFDLIELPPIPAELWSQVTSTIGSKEFSVGCQPMIIGKLDLNSFQEDVRRRAVNSIKQVIDDGSKYGLRAVAVCSGPNVEVERHDEAKDILVESIVELCSYGYERGVRIVLESFDTIHDKKLLTGAVEEAVEAVKEVRKRCSNIGLMWDLSHAPLLNESPKAVKSAADVLTNIHIGCAKKIDEGLRDWHPVFYTKGAINTEEDVADLLAALKEISYKGPISFEVKPEEHQTSLEVINAAKGVLIKAYSQLLTRTLG